MELRLSRYAVNAVSTLGKMYIDGEFQCYTLEDAHHVPKIHGKTRIPAGTYRVFLRKLGTSHFDPNYTRKFGSNWFHGMLQLESVPEFEGVEIHIGNSAADTDGCILVGQIAESHKLNSEGSMQLFQSSMAFEKFYPKLRDALQAGEVVHITVADETAALVA